MSKQIVNLNEFGKGRAVPCIHTISGRVGNYKTCIWNYECSHCLFDQWLDDTDIIAPYKKKRECGKVGIEDSLPIAA